MNIFDIIGPVMIGPSSSHTAGAVRIGKIAGALLKGKPVKATIYLYGSFAKTYKGHGTDKALIAGILGMNPDDPRIRNSLELATEEGLEYHFIKDEMDGAHPNTTRIELVDSQGNEAITQGASIGGGNVVIQKINDMKVEITGQYTTLIVLHNDAPGTIAAVTNYVAAQGMNIGNFRLSRDQKGGTAVMVIEMDALCTDEVNDGIMKLANVISSTLIPPISI
ncbi:L-serine ammonia-lyase, iron-sulfur-dependent subunit beta [Paludicola sp. MB14-C6]|uniref:L-serine ammonia-lyase, iron-sulfur-dependent subunit beta n=1 Tax=Paludihabitans sp. MB14-C6 TaxID=3070656 RepID=UPI0027DB7755|nr:L-serine ammonia-lyase, iron-sulfur-dependent subunit beta [Paludicola sp. MB14-C6]WMJ23890.1 L-serine ammonia-lyase, iron-sulfur-dependent subunit beta [Paludicola sp. MB14-C6]